MALYLNFNFVCHIYVFYVIVMIYQSIFFSYMVQIGFHIPVGGNFS